MLKQGRTISDKPMSAAMLKLCAQKQAECNASIIHMLGNEQIKGAGMDFGVTGAKVRRVGDVGGKGAVVSPFPKSCRCFQRSKRDSLQEPNAFAQENPTA